MSCLSYLQTNSFLNSFFSTANPLTCYLFVLPVDKSDNANGLFGFKSVVPITTPESQNITAVVERQKGTEGSVTVRWAIYKGMTSQLATQDFIHSTGTLVFSERESEKVSFRFCSVTYLFKVPFATMMLCGCCVSS